MHEDVPRVANGDGTCTALLGDPRNDEKVMIAGLHCAHIRSTTGCSTSCPTSTCATGCRPHNGRVAAVRRSTLAEICSVYRPFASSTRLRYYILAEGKLAAGGQNLGPVGARVVTETLIGLLGADPTSYLTVYPRLTPFLGTDLTLGSIPNPNITANRTYTRARFLYYAGVVTPGTSR